MKEFVAKNNFDSKLNSLLLTLPTAFGSLESLESIIANIDDEILQEAMQHLKELYNSLDNQQSIIFDLGMVPTMKYYTGLMIKGYSDKCAQPIISGGRYDYLLPVSYTHLDVYKRQMLHFMELQVCIIFLIN